MTGYTDNVGAIVKDLSAERPSAVDVVSAGHTEDVHTARAGLKNTEATTRAMALGALARSGALTGNELGIAAGDPAVVVRRRAAEEAGRLTSGGAPTAARLLSDDDPTVVEMAAWALGEHCPQTAAVQALAVVATEHEEPLCREAAVAALGAVGHPDGLAAILAGTKDRATVRRRAVLALASFEGDAVDQALVTALDDRDWQVRQAAEDLLGPDLP